MSTLAAAIRTEAGRTVDNGTRTENNMRAYSGTGDALVDLFGSIGSARGQDLSVKFEAALRENQELAMRILLWARDIRGGAGERQTFRTLMVNLNHTNPELALQILPLVPVVGRWDDVLYAYPALSANREAAIAFIGEALRNGDALCAKWMPRQGITAVNIRSTLGYSPKQWRKLLVKLTTVVETQMCAKQWDKINFSHVPSVAAARYQAAFARNAAEAYNTYRTELAKPQSERAKGVKINAGAVYPYTIIQSLTHGASDVADAQWDALPDYVGDNSILPVVDTSGSMQLDVGGVSALDVAVSLGLYCSYKNKGPFADIFVTFSACPEFQLLEGTLSERARQMSTAYWDMNTNLNAVFEKLLLCAIQAAATDEDMPKYILIMSDMQFDECIRHDDNALQMIRRKFNDAGYEIPTVVFWNLRATDNVPVKAQSKDVALISGFSPAIMQSILAAKNITPFDIMMDTISNERYDYLN